jgi:hypothetical protein
MNRRGFIGSLIGAFAGAAVGPISLADAVELPAAPTLLAPELDAAVLSTAAISREALRILTGELGAMLGPRISGGLAGYTGANVRLGAYGVDIVQPCEDLHNLSMREYSARYIAPPIELLAEHLKRKIDGRLIVMGTPTLVSAEACAVATSPRAGVRCVTFYNMMTQQYLSRFDVTAGGLR